MDRGRAPYPRRVNQPMVHANASSPTAVEEQKMSNTHTNTQHATQKHVPQHHQDAAEHHDMASKHHKEAAKQSEAGNHQGAAHHAQIAQGHSVQAAEHGAEVSKTYANQQVETKHV
jgi:hypothetical protein